jgi:hypothetical protein
MIFMTTIRQREIEDAAVKRTAAMRRRRDLRPAPRARDEGTGSLHGIDSRQASGAEEGSETWGER